MQKHSYYSETANSIQSTAGAVLVQIEKGQTSVKKVKVTRYISGKRPVYARSSGDESDEEKFINYPKLKHRDEDKPVEIKVEDDDIEFSELEKTDRRLQRLMTKGYQCEERRSIEEPAILCDQSTNFNRESTGKRHESTSESEEEILDDDTLELRRALVRRRALQTQQELLAKEEELISEGEISASEYEETTESDEDALPRLKPVFVKKDERTTVKGREAEESCARQLEQQIKVKKIQRRKETLKFVEEEMQKDRVRRYANDGKGDTTQHKISDVVTDDEDEAADFELWKIRELTRIKRDREERDQYAKELEEMERVHNLTEEQRRKEMMLKPKTISNKAIQGKYKFLQKYYHRGAFFMDKEDEVYKRDVAKPTLEDRFDKAVLPKVMQVKNFGRSGRSKYTHLVDQDTTNFDSAWMSDSVANHKFHKTQAAGVRPVFEKPKVKQARRDEK